VIDTVSQDNKIVAEDEITTLGTFNNVIWGRCDPSPANLLDVVQNLELDDVGGEIDELRKWWWASL